MATQPPFSVLDTLLQGLRTQLAPPPWAVAEAQRRIALLLNHILSQESEAVARLGRQQGRVVSVRWRDMALRLRVTPAGLLEVAAGDAPADLSLSLTQELVRDLAQTIIRGAKPDVRIDGDVQLAAEVNWLVDNVRWDVEEDLARVLGDVPAHAVAGAARRLSHGLRQFLDQPSAADRAPP